MKTVLPVPESGLVALGHEPLLVVEDLVVEFAATRGTATRGTATHETARPDRCAVVNGAHLEIRPGEILGLIGASGAGKTMTALSLLRLLPAGGRVTGGRALWRGRDLLALPEPELRAVRGREIGMIFQDPIAALHPLLRIDAQVAEAICAHAPHTRWRDAMERATALLCELGVPLERVRSAPYAHQWSGGMCQRAMLAMAIVNGPALLIADEPTTALDAVTQAQVLRLLKELQMRSPIAILLITHDLSVIAESADRVAVMEAGRVIEVGTVAEILDHPTEPGTMRLVARPRPRAPRGASADSGAVTLTADALRVTYRVRGDKAVHAVTDLSLSVAEGETLGLVGESGAGKSSLARALVRLTPLESGRVMLRGEDLTAMEGATLQRARREVQIVFQNPYASLNPRRTVGASIAEPLRIQRQFGADGPAQVMRALESVGLPGTFADRYPRQLSGGERQRVAIARALVLSPRILVLDEPVSSLDGPTRESILALLLQLQEDRGLGYLFISHDLEVVCRIAHRVAVMQQGRIVEVGTAEAVHDRPTHPYTRELLAARPSRDYRVAGSATA